MTESALVNTWNSLRKSITQAQISSVIVLAVVLALVATGQFAGASLGVKLFALGVMVSTGALSLISQFAAIREGAAVVADLAGATSATEKVIADSGKYLKLTQAAMVVFAIAVLVLFVVAVF
jgi:hypothetical protein